jgi:hypothetical protein
MANRRCLCIYVRRPGLAAALTRALEGRLDAGVETVTALNGRFSSRVLLTTSADCDIAACTALASGGIQVVVLAVRPGAAEQARYVAAGARAYLPMELDVTPLIETLEGLLA